MTTAWRCTFVYTFRGNTGFRNDYSARGSSPKFRGRNFGRGGNSTGVFRGGTANGPRSGSRFHGSSNWDNDWNSAANTDTARNDIPPLMSTVIVLKFCLCIFRFNFKFPLRFCSCRIQVRHHFSWAIITDLMIATQHLWTQTSRY